MVKKENFNAEDLYLLRPSNIVDVKGGLIDEKGTAMYQIATFETTDSPVIAYFNQTYNQLTDVFAEEASDLKNNISLLKFYYNERSLHRSGVNRLALNREFINVFPGDTTLFSDFIYASNLDSTRLSTRIKFFRFPLNIETMDLKPKLSNYLLQSYPAYTLEELRELKESIDCIESKGRLTRRVYIINKDFHRKLPELTAIFKLKTELSSSYSFQKLKHQN